MRFSAGTGQSRWSCRRSAGARPRVRRDASASARSRGHSLHVKGGPPTQQAILPHGAGRWACNLTPSAITGSTPRAAAPPRPSIAAQELGRPERPPQPRFPGADGRYCAAANAALRASRRSALIRWPNSGVISWGRNKRGSAPHREQPEPSASASHAGTATRLSHRRACAPWLGRASARSQRSRWRRLALHTAVRPQSSSHAVELAMTGAPTIVYPTHCVWVFPRSSGSSEGCVLQETSI